MKAEQLVAAGDQLGFERGEFIDPRIRVDAGAKGGTPREIEVHPEVARFRGVQTLEQLA